MPPPYTTLEDVEKVIDFTLEHSDPIDIRIESPLTVVLAPGAPSLSVMVDKVNVEDAFDVQIVLTEEQKAALLVDLYYFVAALKRSFRSIDGLIKEDPKMITTQFPALAILRHLVSQYSDPVIIFVFRKNLNKIEIYVDNHPDFEDFAKMMYPNFANIYPITVKIEPVEFFSIASAEKKKKKQVPVIAKGYFFISEKEIKLDSIRNGDFEYLSAEDILVDLKKFVFALATEIQAKIHGLLVAEKSAQTTNEIIRVMKLIRFPDQKQLSLIVKIILLVIGLVVLGFLVYHYVFK